MSEIGKIFYLKTRIISHLNIAPQHFKMILEAPQIAKEAKPGQFIHVKVSEGINPLLRRPFSIHRVIDKEIEILYKIRGKGTEILSQRKEGELLDIIGPLGNGFPFGEEQNKNILLVAGGIGIAPLIFLAEKLREIKNQKSKIKIIALLGAKTKDFVLCEKELKDLCTEVKISTEDGSYGFKGLVTELLKNSLTPDYSSLTTLYTAGPLLMLQEIKKIANIFKILVFASLEENIACGLGGCLGCVIKTKQGYKRVCKDGPVFNLEEVLWE